MMTFQSLRDKRSSHLKHRGWSKPYEIAPGTDDHALPTEEGKISDVERVEFQEFVTAKRKQYISLGKNGEKKKTFFFSLEVCLLCIFVFTLLYAYYCRNGFHYYVAAFYAHLGYAEAQHILGQRYIQGLGVQKNHAAAMQWFKKAADQGHVHASYNLAVGHMKGYRTGIERGDAHKLVKYAARKGLKEAKDLLIKECSEGDCD